MRHCTFAALISTACGLKQSPEAPAADWVLGCRWPILVFVDGDKGPDRADLVRSSQHGASRQAC